MLVYRIITEFLGSVLITLLFLGFINTMWDDLSGWFKQKRGKC